jgi:hypothetical protein
MVISRRRAIAAADSLLAVSTRATGPVLADASFGAPPGVYLTVPPRPASPLNEPPATEALRGIVYTAYYDRV